MPFNVIQASIDDITSDLREVCLIVLIATSLKVIDFLFRMLVLREMRFKYYH